MAFDIFSTAARGVVIGAAALTASVVVMPQGWAADAVNGQRIAQRWCAACHVVAPGQQQVTGEAPPFAAIAKRPDFSADRIAFFLLAPHPVMPDMGLSRQATQDIAAYIATLNQ
jgi:mono/diheme cytochrome c family protein